MLALVIMSCWLAVTISVNVMRMKIVSVSVTPYGIVFEGDWWRIKWACNSLDGSKCWILRISIKCHFLCLDKSSNYFLFWSCLLWYVYNCLRSICIKQWHVACQQHPSLGLFPYFQVSLQPQTCILASNLAWGMVELKEVDMIFKWHFVETFVSAHTQMIFGRGNIKGERDFFKYPVSSSWSALWLSYGFKRTSKQAWNSFGIMVSCFFRLIQI